VAGLLAAKFRNGGQTCVSPNRIYVQRSVYAWFATLLGAKVAELRVGPATDPASQIGPMINARAIEKIASHVDDAVANIAKIRDASIVSRGRSRLGSSVSTRARPRPT
jgi:succinate-semialdehyde dehydrogenase/glutarate-semialdehyde dehydrogenase